jgi:hypothetical protein
MIQTMVAVASGHVQAAIVVFVFGLDERGRAVPVDELAELVQLAVTCAEQGIFELVRAGAVGEPGRHHANGLNRARKKKVEILGSRFFAIDVRPPASRLDMSERKRKWDQAGDPDAEGGPAAKQATGSADPGEKTSNPPADAAEQAGHSIPVPFCARRI